MVKILLTILFSLCLSQAHATSISLELDNIDKQKDTHGTMVPTAYIGDTITVKVTVSKADRNIGTVSVDGLNQFTIFGQRQFSEMTMINNALFTNNIYHYTFTLDKPGTFKLGPARVGVKGGKTIQSNTVTLQVLEDSGDRKAPPTDVDNEEEDDESEDPVLEQDEPAQPQAIRPELFCTVKPSSTQIFVGEPLELVIQIHARGPIQQVAIQPPTFPGFAKKEIKQFLKKKKVINGKQYDVREKKYILTPTESGEKQIAPIQIQYTFEKVRKRPQRGHGFFDNFFMGGFFGRAFIQQSSTRSKPVSINVDELPEFQGYVDGVGTFTSFTAKLDKQQATVNEAIMLKLEVQGKGNLDQIPDLTLDLPEDVSSYKSQASVQEDLSLNYTGGKKTFEYVIQIKKDGQITIPAQTFTYFDPSKQEYVSLQTKPQTVSIKPGQATPQESMKKFISSDDDEEEYAVAPEGKDIHFIEEDAKIKKHERMKLPIWIFLLLFLLPLLLFNKAILLNIRKRITLPWSAQREYKKKIAQNEADLEQMIGSGQAKKLYHFFLKFLAIKFKEDVELVTEKWIEQTMRTRENWDKKKITEFLEYLNECASMHFIVHEKNKDEKVALLKKAKYWFLILSK